MEIQKIISAYNFDGFLVLFEKYRTYFLVGALGLATVLGVGVYWYFYSIKYEQSAMQAFSEVLVEYNRGVEASEIWPEVEVSAKTGYKQYSHSSLAPFFLGLQVDALLGQQKHDEALSVMKMMLEKLSSRSRVFHLYKIKEARMKLDSAEPAVQSDGLQQLVALTNDKNNSYQDQALYFLGMYYESHDQKDKAQEIWQQLSALKSSDANAVSPWVLLAEQRRA